MAKGRLLYVPEIAERIRRTEKSTRWLIQTGALAPTAKVAGRRMMREDDLEKWIEAQFAKEAS